MNQPAGWPDGARVAVCLNVACEAWPEGKWPGVSPLPPLPAPWPPLPVPAPPPLPFTYVGKQRVGDAWQVFIADKEELRIVKVADVIAQQYKVLAIDPPTMTLDYLPLHEVQQLRLE